MDTQTFLDRLEPHSGAALVFELPGGFRLEPGYHVTEVAHASYQSMDCGGQANAWRETVVQLKGPSACGEPEFMRVGKFLAIYCRVAASVPVGGEDDLRLEYGDAERPAVRYHVAGLEADAGELLVRLASPGVSCKPQERQRMILDELPVVGCC